MTWGAWNPKRLPQLRSLFDIAAREHPAAVTTWLEERTPSRPGDLAHDKPTVALARFASAGDKERVRQLIDFAKRTNTVKELLSKSAPAGAAWEQPNGNGEGLYSYGGLLSAARAGHEDVALTLLKEVKEAGLATHALADQAAVFLLAQEACARDQVRLLRAILELGQHVQNADHEQTVPFLEKRYEMSRAGMRAMLLLASSRASYSDPLARFDGAPLGIALGRKSYEILDEMAHNAEAHPSVADAMRPLLELWVRHERLRQLVSGNEEAADQLDRLAPENVATRLRQITSYLRSNEGPATAARRLAYREILTLAIAKRDPRLLHALAEVVAEETESQHSRLEGALVRHIDNGVIPRDVLTAGSPLGDSDDDVTNTAPIIAQLARRTAEIVPEPLERDASRTMQRLAPRSRRHTTQKPQDKSSSNMDARQEPGSALTTTVVNQELFRELLPALSRADAIEDTKGLGAEWARRMASVFDTVDEAERYLDAVNVWVAPLLEARPAFYTHTARHGATAIHWPGKLREGKPEYRNADFFRIALDFEPPTQPFDKRAWKQLILEHPEVARYVADAPAIERALKKRARSVSDGIDVVREAVLEQALKVLGAESKFEDLRPRLRRTATKATKVSRRPDLDVDLALNLPVLVDEETARAVDHLSWLGVLGTLTLMRENAEPFVRTAGGEIEMRDPEPGDLGTAYWTAAQLVVDGPRISEAGSETAHVAALLDSAPGAAAHSDLHRDIEINLARLAPKHALELTKQVMIDYLHSAPEAVARIFGKGNPFGLQADGRALHKQTLAAIAEAEAFDDLPDSMTGSPLALREDRIEFSQSPFGLSPQENKGFVAAVTRVIADSQRTLDAHDGEAHVPEDALPSSHARPKLTSD